MRSGVGVVVVVVALAGSGVGLCFPRPEACQVLVSDARSALGFEVVRQLLRKKRDNPKAGDTEVVIAGVIAVTTDDRQPLLLLDDGGLTIRDGAEAALGELGEAETNRVRAIATGPVSSALARRCEHVVSLGEVCTEASWTAVTTAEFMHEAKERAAKKRVACVDVTDAAAAVVALALAADVARYARRRYHLTGPAAIDVTDYLEPTDTKDDADTKDDDVAVTDHVEALTGRPPLTFADHLSSRPNWRRRYRRLLPFDEIRRMARGLGLSTETDFDDWLNNGGRGLEFGPYFPTNPKDMYHDEWISWADFLGARRDYADAKRLVKNMGIKSQEDWWHFTETNSDLLADLRVPTRPHKVYKADFVGYDDWLSLSVPPLTLPSDLARRAAQQQDDDDDAPDDDRRPADRRPS